MNILIINDNIYVDIIEFSETLINGTSANIMCQSSRFYDIEGQDLTVQDMGEKLANIKEFSLQVINNENEILWKSKDYNKISHISIIIDNEIVKYNIGFCIL